jgi:hypothetical protein
LAPPPSNVLLACGGALAAFSVAADCSAQERTGVDEPTAERPALARRELPSPKVRTTVREESSNPLRQSVFVFDQSMTTQTANLGPAPQSYVPLYEIWLSLRPRYYFDEHWSVRGRFDYTKELTNSQTTTYYREDVFGDIWTDLVYSRKLDPWWPETKVNLGLRALWPTSKASRADGTYVTLGVRGGADHRFEIRGEDAPLWNNVYVGLSFAYLHPFTPATTATAYGGFENRRQDVDGFSFLGDQLTGETLPEHIVWVDLSAGLQVTPRLSLGGDFITVNEWHYAPTGDVRVHVAGGTAAVAAPRNDNQFTESTWLVAGADYALLDELDLGVGYYNLANAIAPDGRARSAFGSDTIWWSPDARVFFDLTANLDILWADAHKSSKTRSDVGTRAQRIAAHLR